MSTPLPEPEPSEPVSCPPPDGEGASTRRRSRLTSRPATAEAGFLDLLDGPCGDLFSECAKALVLFKRVLSKPKDVDADLVSIWERALGKAGIAAEEVIGAADRLVAVQGVFPSPSDLIRLVRSTAPERLAGLPYQEYLRTTHWSVMRECALRRARHRCQVCNSPHELEVHHRTYERVGNEDLEDLTVLCARCHEKFHDREHDGR